MPQLAARLKLKSVTIDHKEMAINVLNGFTSPFESLIVTIDVLGNEEKSFGIDYCIQCQPAKRKQNTQEIPVCSRIGSLRVRVVVKEMCS